MFGLRKLFGFLRGRGWRNSRSAPPPALPDRTASPQRLLPAPSRCFLLREPPSPREPTAQVEPSVPAEPQLNHSQA
jgi:hypothetical protein